MEKERTNGYQGAGVVRRIVAFLVDDIIISLISGILLGIAMMITGRDLAGISNGNLTAGNQLTVVVTAIVFLLYGSLMEQGKKRHATLGKRLMKIRVAGINGQTPEKLDIWFRNSVKILPLLLAGLLYNTSLGGILSLVWYVLLLIGLFMKKHRGLHDKLAGTIVVGKDEAYPAAEAKSGIENIPLKEEAGADNNADAGKTMAGIRQTAPAFYLIGLTGQYAGMELKITETITIGREVSACNLVMDSHTSGISRVHLRIYPAGSQLMAEDMGSSYGTVLGNGQRLEAHKPMAMQSGTVLRMGEKEQFQIIAK